MRAGCRARLSWRDPVLIDLLHLAAAAGLFFSLTAAFSTLLED